LISPCTPPLQIFFSPPFGGNVVYAGQRSSNSKCYLFFFWIWNFLFPNFSSICFFFLVLSGFFQVFLCFVLDYLCPPLPGAFFFVFLVRSPFVFSSIIKRPVPLITSFGRMVMRLSFHPTFAQTYFPFSPCALIPSFLEARRCC